MTLDELAGRLYELRQRFGGEAEVLFTRQGPGIMDVVGEALSGTIVIRGANPS